MRSGRGCRCQTPAQTYGPRLGLPWPGGAASRSSPVLRPGIRSTPVNSTRPSSALPRMFDGPRCSPETVGVWRVNITYVPARAGRRPRRRSRNPTPLRRSTKAWKPFAPMGWVVAASDRHVRRKSPQPTPETLNPRVVASTLALATGTASPNTTSHPVNGQELRLTEKGVAGVRIPGMGPGHRERETGLAPCSRPPQVRRSLPVLLAGTIPVAESIGRLGIVRRCCAGAHHVTAAWRWHANRPRWGGRDSPRTRGRRRMAFQVLRADELDWRVTNPPGVANTNLNGGFGFFGFTARARRLDPGQAMPRHRHRIHTELYVVLEGRGRLRVEGTLLELARLSAVLVDPDSLRQVFNDTDAAATWLIVGDRRALCDLQRALCRRAPTPVPGRHHGPAPRAAGPPPPGPVGRRATADGADRWPTTNVLPAACGSCSLRVGISVIVAPAARGA